MVCCSDSHAGPFRPFGPLLRPMIYLDSNATTQVDPEVLEAMLPFWREHYANPSASYAPARSVRRAIENARGEVAALLKAQPEEIVFTSCGTESINATHASAQRLWPERPCLVVGTTEHSAVIESARRWQQQGGEVLWAPVDRNGVLNTAELRRLIRPGVTALVSVMWANNETGVIHPISEVVEIAHSAGALMHVDAVQAVGKMATDLAAIPIDYLSLSGHKFHAPKGAGALFVSSRVPFDPWLVGGGQESGRRSGTENVAGIVGLGKAAALMVRGLAGDAEQKIREMRVEFERRLLGALPETVVNGGGAERLTTTSSVCFPGVDAAGLLILLDRAGICCAAGSACHSGAVHPSHVLEAMGYDAQHAASTLRFSFSRFNTAAEVAEAAELVIQSVRRMRELWSAEAGPVFQV